MPAQHTLGNGVSQPWVVVRDEPSGQFTAQMVGLPELRATAATREESLNQVRLLIDDWIASGRLVNLEAPGENPLLNFPGHLDPDDPLEREFVEEMARRHREDVERTLKEDDPECSNSSSTPTT